MAPQDCSACGKPATMQCPNCIKLSISEGSYFCTQDCFKANWGTHKAIHKAAKAALKMKAGPLVWKGFDFSGDLRPWPQSPRRKVPDSIAKPDYALTGDPVSERTARGSSQIRILTPEQQDKMRAVCVLGREILDAAGAAIGIGVTTDEIDRVVHEATLERDCYPSPLNYYGFPKSCCTSVNEVVCHGIPDGYALKDGDIVNVDISCYHDGFHADLNETFLVGNVDEASIKLVRTTYECLFKSIEACKPGMRYRDLGNIISKHAHEQGFSVVRTYCGHGINQLFHTTPNIPHYAKNKAIGVMKPGQTFTIEPMINAGTYHEFGWRDDWTSTTRDGKRSAQFEHTLLVTEVGVDILTKRLPSSPAGNVWFETHSPPMATADS